MCAIDGAKMKVDKAVSTSNDIAINDLHNGLRYESILNTLVEKKILAIKRDCEQSEQKLKQQRKHNCLGGLLFGKRRRQLQRELDEVQQQPAESEPRETTNVDGNAHRSECSRLADAIVINECVAVGDATATNDDVENAIVLVNRNKLIETDNNQQFGRHANDVAGEKPTDANAESEDCGSNSTIASQSPMQAHDVAKSTSLLQGDALRPARKISSDTIISIPSASKHTTFSAPAPIVECTIDQEQRRRLRVLEAKSISAQCSPIFPRQSFAGEATVTPSPVAKLKSTIPLRLMSRQNTSDDSVNVTFSSVLVNEDAVDSGDAASDNVTAIKKVQPRKRDGHKLGRCSVANEAHGFISSFNQLTSSNNLPPVISTTKLRSGAAPETTRLPRFQPLPVVDTARTLATASPANDSCAMQKSIGSGRSSDEDEPIKNDRRKHRKCGKLQSCPVFD